MLKSTQGGNKYYSNNFEKLTTNQVFISNKCIICWHHYGIFTSETKSGLNAFQTAL